MKTQFHSQLCNSKLVKPSIVVTKQLTLYTHRFKTELIVMKLREIVKRQTLHRCCKSESN